MDRRWPLLLLLLAAAGAVWFLVGDLVDEPGRHVSELDLEAPGASDPAPLEAGASPTEAPGEAPEEEPDPVGEAEPEPEKKVQPTTGGLEVRVTDKSGRVLAPEGVIARVRYVDRVDRGAISGEVDEGSAVFRFRELPLGDVRVHVEGDLVLPAMSRSRVQAGTTGSITLAVVRAAALRYDVQYPDRSRPEEVRLSLVDGAGKAVSARYRKPDDTGARARAQRGRTVRMPPQGVVYGLPEGTYTLKAAVLKGRLGETTVTVNAGDSTAVTVVLDR